MPFSLEEASYMSVGIYARVVLGLKPSVIGSDLN